METLPITHWNLQKELRLDKEISRSISWALERGTHKIGYEKNADLMGIETPGRPLEKTILIAEKDFFDHSKVRLTAKGH